MYCNARQIEYYHSGSFPGNPLIEWDSLCLERLMDETTCLENDHLPMEQQASIFLYIP